MSKPHRDLIAEIERLTAECNRRKAEERRCLDQIDMLCAERDRLRASCLDLLAVVRGELSGPAQLSGVIQEAERALAEGTKK